MDAPFDGLSIARARIAEEAERRTGVLDLANLGLTQLPPELFELRHLRELYLGPGPTYDSEIAKFSSTFGPNNSIGGRLDFVGELADMEVLSVCHTNVSSLESLAGLQHLNWLDCSGTQVSALEPLAGLGALQILDCSTTQVSDLRPLAGSSALQMLDCSGTQVSDLKPVAGLSALQEIDCSGTKVSNLEPLAGLGALRMLDCSDTQVSDLGPLVGLSALRMLDCSDTQVSDLKPLAGLGALQTLYCSSTKVSNLEPLYGLSALQTLYCSNSQVFDLRPVAGLRALRMLSCSRTQVSDLSPVAGLSTLQTLVCSHTQVSDLEPLAGLGALQTLYCSSTKVSNLEPLAGLSALQEIECSSTKVSNLGPLVGLSALQKLYCSSTQVSDLEPLAELSALQEIDCSGTKVSNLEPLAGLGALQTLNCSHCRLTSIPSDFWRKASLTKLFLVGCHVPGVPAEVLSQPGSNNCLDSLRAHLDDLATERSVVPDIKLLILGNGGAGKTQFCRRLRGEPFDLRWDSTHGIRVTSASLPMTEGEEPVRLHTWDFGGQDIYHGTHALFVRTRALVLLVWAKDKENSDEYEEGNLRFRNHPLQYWVDYVRHQGDVDSPILILQNKCDEPKDEVRRFPVTAESLEALAARYYQELHYSAAIDRRRAALDEILREAIRWLRDPNRQGLPMIGAGRLRVQRRLEAMRDADAELPSEQRQHRTLDQDEFRRFCEEAGDISSPAYLLGYLHNAGTIFYQPGLFDDRIVLDQEWALNAIYAVFQRQNCYRQLRWRHGRFNRIDLDLLVWRDLGIGEEEQKLFLSMMQSCGICFIHRQHRNCDDEETEYVAPDLLPERQAMQSDLDAMWPPDQLTEAVTYEYDFLHSGLIREVIARIGGEAGINALYWKGGICVYETTTRSHALIEQQMTGDWAGEIRLQTQGGQAEQLLEQLERRMENAQARIGLCAANIERSSTRHNNEPIVVSASEAGGEPKLSFGQPPVTQPEWFVSYAWGDDTQEGRARDEVVDSLCAAAKQRRICIQRDKTTLGLGERISKFMRRIGEGNRVFVILSDKYLQSPNCMFELHEIWRTSGSEGDEFLKRVRVYSLPDAKIWTLHDRAQYAVFWKNELKKVETLSKQHGAEILGELGYKQFVLMGNF